jgi:hypothetical protein
MCTFDVLVTHADVRLLCQVRHKQSEGVLPGGVDKAVSAVNMLADRLKGLDAGVCSSSSWHSLCASLCTLFPHLFQRAVPRTPCSPGGMGAMGAKSPAMTHLMMDVTANNPGMLSPLSTAIKTADRMFSEGGMPSPVILRMPTAAAERGSPMMSTRLSRSTSVAVLTPLRPSPVQHTPPLPVSGPEAALLPAVPTSDEGLGSMPEQVNGEEAMQPSNLLAERLERLALTAQPAATTKMSSKENTCSMKAAASTPRGVVAAKAAALEAAGTPSTLWMSSKWKTTSTPLGKSNCNITRGAAVAPPGSPLTR